jgi:hypothetical protein
MMLQHRPTDEAKRQDPWVAKLCRIADHTIETTPLRKLYSSKNTRLNERMRKRACEDILPNLFKIAALYEDHFVYKGTRRTDPGNGTSVTWHRLAKRGRQTKAAQALRTELDVNATKVNNTLTRVHLRQTQQAQSQAQQLQNPSVLLSRQHILETPAPTVSAGASALSASQQDRHILSSTTSNISFGQHVDGLRLNEEMNANMPSHAPHNDDPMQYFTSYADYNFPVYNTHSSPHSVQPSFGSGNVPSFAHPFPVFPASQDDSLASNNAQFPFTPSNMPFYSLPLNPGAYY